MSESSKAGGDGAEDALRSGFKAAGLSPEALERIRRATEAEWRASVGQAPPSRWRSNRWKVASAAGVLLLVAASVVGIIGYDNRSSSGALVARVERGDVPGIELMQVLRSDRPLPVGSELRVFARLNARGDALLTLAGGGNLRVARGSAFDLPDARTVRLTRGELYVDIPPGARGAESLVVSTSAGEFRHLGTQFGVAVVGNQTRLRVREGNVLWRAPDGEQTVDAGTEIVTDGRELSRRAIPTTGRDWSWVESLAPELDIENRPLQEFLHWFARETGRKLVLGDAAARQQAHTIRMHGSVRGLTAMEALSAVMAATTLHYELPEGVIRVSSGREPRPSS
jgi:hypothetical protein